MHISAQLLKGRFKAILHIRLQQDEKRWNQHRRCQTRSLILPKFFIPYYIFWRSNTFIAMFSAPYIETLVIGNIPLRCDPLYADSNDYDNNDIYHHIQYVVMKNNRNCIIINNIIVTIIVSVSWELPLTFCLRTTENSSFIWTKNTTNLASIYPFWVPVCLLCQNLEI